MSTQQYDELEAIEDALIYLSNTFQLELRRITGHTADGEDGWGFSQRGTTFGKCGDTIKEAVLAMLFQRLRQAKLEALRIQKNLDQQMSVAQSLEATINLIRRSEESETSS